MPVPFVRYRCEYCKKHYSNKYGAERHEATCHYNPIHKTCSSCVHFTRRSRLDHTAGYFNLCALNKFDSDADWVRNCDWWSGEITDMVSDREVQVHLADLDALEEGLDYGEAGSSSQGELDSD